MFVPFKPKLQKNSSFVMKHCYRNVGLSIFSKSQHLKQMAKNHVQQHKK